MTRSPQNGKSKRTKITVHKPKAKKPRLGSGSLVVLAPTTTRRGKIVYTEVDAAPFYKSSDEEGDSPKRKLSKTPSTPGPSGPSGPSGSTRRSTRSRAVVPAEDAFQWEASQPYVLEPYVPRITKVRLRL